MFFGKTPITKQYYYTEDKFFVFPFSGKPKNNL